MDEAAPVGSAGLALFCMQIFPSLRWRDCLRRDYQSLEKWVIVSIIFQTARVRRTVVSCEVMGKDVKKLR